MIKLTFILLINLFLVSCATTPGARFPNYQEHAKTISSVDVLLDIFISGDIDGPIPGIDIGRHRQVADSLSGEIKRILGQKGYQVKSIHVNGGLFIDWEKLQEDHAKRMAGKAAKDSSNQFKFGANSEEVDHKVGSTESQFDADAPALVFASNDKSTGQPVTGPYLEPDAKPWAEPNMRIFLQQALQQSSTFFSYDANRGSDSPSLALDQMPASIANLNSDAFVIVRVNAGEVDAAKSVGVGMLTGILSLVASGGTYIAVSTPVDGYLTETAIFDPAGGEILWYNSARLQGSGDSNYALETLFKPLNEGAAGKQATLLSEPVSAAVEELAPATVDLSGTYISSITSSHYWRFNTEEEKSLVLNFTQNGQDIVAENTKFDLKILGKLNGDKISFYALPNKMTSFEITGEWNLISDSDRLQGNWDLKHSQHPASGEWNLRKLR